MVRKEIRLQEDLDNVNGESARIARKVVLEFVNEFITWTGDMAGPTGLVDVDKMFAAREKAFVDRFRTSVAKAGITPVKESKGKGKKRLRLDDSDLEERSPVKVEAVQPAKVVQEASGETRDESEG